jgi:regulator of replication initiation timing
MAQEIDEALVETAKEADRQKKFVESQSDMLRHRLRHVSRESHSLARHRLNENSNLLFECNDLRMEAKELNRKLAIRRNDLDVAQRTIKELRALLAVQSRTSSPVGERQKTKTLPPVSTTATGAASMTGAASTAAIAESALTGEPVESRLPAQWVVHNALHHHDGSEESRAKSDAAEPVLAPIRGKPLPTDGARKMHKSAISQSAPALSDSVSPPTRNANTVSASTDQLSSLGVGMTKQLTLAVPRATDLKVRRRPSNVTSLTGTDWQVDKLSKEVDNLAAQLDDAVREREVQRLEINRLKKLVMSTSALSNSPSHQQQMLLSNSTSQAMQLQLPSLTRSSMSYADDGMLRQPSNSELYGVPSEAEREELQLRPVSSGNAAPGLTRNNTQNAYLSNPNILATQKSSGRVSIVQWCYLRELRHSFAGFPVPIAQRVCARVSPSCFCFSYSH